MDQHTSLWMRRIRENVKEEEAERKSERQRERERERDEIWMQATFQGAMSFQALVCFSGDY